MILSRITIIIVVLYSVSGCGTQPSKAPDIVSEDPSLPWEPPSARGNPPFYTVFGKRYQVLSTSEGYRQQGLASWYGSQFHGKPTSSGSPFDMYSISAAHKSLPIPTYVRVTHLENGRQLVVRVNDRGPFVQGRIIDLSYAAAMELGMVESGTAPVEVVALPPYQYLSHLSKSDSQSRARENPSQETPIAPAETASAGPRPLVDQSAQDIPDSPQVYLQLGAFAQRSNALQLQDRLMSQLDYPVTINSLYKLHKVRVGPFTTIDEARSLSLQIVALGLDRPHITFD